MHAFIYLVLSFKFYCFLVLVDAAAVDNNSRISPENNIDFYAYSQGAPYSVKFYFIIF
jgi:hypothetical protein